MKIKTYASFAANQGWFPVQGLTRALGHLCHDKAGLAIHGTNRENVLTANAVTYTVDFQLYTLAAQTEIDLSTLGTFSALSNGYTAWYLLSVDSGGTISLTAGNPVLTAAGADMPAVPDDESPFGAIKVQNQSGASFTIGTTLLNTSGLTVGYADLAWVSSGMSAIGQ